MKSPPLLWRRTKPLTAAPAAVPSPESPPLPPRAHTYTHEPPTIDVVGLPERSDIDAVIALPARRPMLGACLVLALTAVLWWSFNRFDVSTGIGEGRTVRLADGSSLQLDTDTAVDVALDGRERRFNLAHGEIYVETSPSTSRPLRVDAGIGRVQAQDAALSVRRDGDGTVAVTVERGQAEVSGGALDSTLVLLSGDRIRFDELAHSGVQRGTAARALAWRRGQLQFENEALAQVMDEVRRHDPRQWVLLAGAAADTRMSTVVDVNRIDAWLDTLSETLPLEIVRLGPSVLAFERRPDVPAPDFANAMR